MSAWSRFSSFLDIAAPFRQIWRNRELVWMMSVRSIESQFNGSYLGIFWSFIQPLFMLGIYTFVFSTIFHARFGSDPRYAVKGAYSVILFSGMAVYHIFSETVSKSSTLIGKNRNLVRKVVFPLELLPVINLFSVLLLSLVHLVLVMIGGAIVLGSFSWKVLLLPVTLVPLLLFACGCSYVAAALGVFFRDLPYLLSLLLQMWFYLTPIIYPVTIVPERYRWLYKFNPMATLVEQTRRFLIYDSLPNFKLCLTVLVASWLVFQIGYFLFMKTKRGFADVL